MSKILVVEDEPALRVAYHKILSIEGFQVQVAGDGFEALRVLERFRPDLILLDILMPRLDGVGFLRQAKIKQNHPHTKVVAFSNLSYEGMLDDIRRLGASHHLLKASLSPKELVEAIRHLL